MTFRLSWYQKTNPGQSGRRALIGTENMKDFEQATVKLQVLLNEKMEVRILPLEKP